MHRVDQAEAAQRVAGLQRVVEELAVVVDARQARHRDELVAEDLVPERLHRLDLGEEPVAADVEAKALVLHGARDAAHHIVGLEDGGPYAVPSTAGMRRQAGRTRADNDDVLPGQEWRDDSRLGRVRAAVM